MQQVSSSSSKGRLATKEKEAAVQQITAEQLLREAAALQSDEVRTGTGRRMVDEDELNEYRVRKRKQFEDSLRRRRTAMNIWTSYALWEAAQNDFRRARSVFERALEVDEKNVEIWKKYLDMEEQNGFVNSARNLYDRITCQLPRFDHFWLRYVKFEELLSNYGGCRLIYERWMEHQPDDRAWILYAQFEERCNEIERARAVMESYLVVHPKITSFLKFAQWEEQHRMYDRARSAFLKAMEILPEEHLNENFFLKFAKFEERCKNFHLVEQLCLHGIAKNQQPSSSPLLTSYYIGFQKRNGNSQQIENIVLDQRRKDYHLLLQQTSEYDYDIWLNLIRLEESTGDYQNILKIYEQFITKVPPVQTKRSWKRYFYIFLNYAIYEELTNNNEENARNILHKLLSLVPHHIFSFTKLWIYLAQFELRMRKLDQARLVFGQAIAKYPNPKIFKTYSNIELKLGNLQRARTILAKYIEIHPSSAQSWLAFIDLELVLQEYSRARSLFELAIQNQNHIENAEVIWKAYIDVETNLKEFDRARDLFKRLIDQTTHWRTYLSLAEFEWQAVADIERARKALQTGIDVCKEKDQDEERAHLLDYWLNLEQEIGNQSEIETVKEMQPKRIKKRRTIVLSDGTTESLEEYTAFIFPDETANASSFAILEAAKKWKKRKQKDL